MKKRRSLTTILAVCMLLALAVPAFALEYTFDEDEQSGYGKPTSVDPVVTADGGAQKNEDISKNAALIPPGFGTPTSNTLNTGEYLTPDLVPSAMPATGATEFQSYLNTHYIIRCRSTRTYIIIFYVYVSIRIRYTREARFYKQCHSVRYVIFAL